MENLNIDWLTRIFTYSSIQVKFIATFAAILIFIILRKIILKIVFRKTDDALIRYRWQKTSSYIIYADALIVIGRIWFKCTSSDTRRIRNMEGIYKFMGR